MEGILRNRLQFWTFSNVSPANMNVNGLSESVLQLPQASK
jgi:hypothetical protein